MATATLQESSQLQPDCKIHNCSQQKYYHEVPWRITHTIITQEWREYNCSSASQWQYLKFLLTEAPHSNYTSLNRLLREEGREEGKKCGSTLGITVGRGANRHGMMTDIMEWTPRNDWEGINKQEWVNSALRASRRTAGEKREKLLKSAVSNHPMASLRRLP